MANPLPNEKELYEKIEKEGITIAPDIWDLLYNRIGDDITAINLLCQYYLNNQQPIPVAEAEKILNFTSHIKKIVNEITVTTKDKFPFPEFLDDVPLHPVLREMLTHYIGNDVYAINLMIDVTFEPEPLSLEIVQRILNHTQTIKEFMERLRVATAHEKVFSPPQEKTNNANNKELTKDEILLKIRNCLAKEFNLSDPEKIQLNCHFQEDLGLDSVDAIRVVMALEDEFGLEIPDDAVDGVLNVSQTVEYISKRLKGSH